MVRLKFLDGLRGWAAIFVLLYHVFCDAIPFDPALAGRLQLFLPFSGAIAIFIFFIVSGFSLSADYLARGDLQTWTRTAVSRYFRLVIPIFFACLLVHVAMVLGGISPAVDRLAPFRNALHFEPTVSHLLRFSLYGVFFNYSDTYIGPLWTMRIELAGSFIALAAALVVRPAPYRPLLFLSMASMLLMFTADSFYAMLALFPIGCALADGFSRGWIARIPSYASAALIIGGAIIPLTFPFSVTMWGAIGTTAIVVGCIALPMTRRLLESGLSAWLGEICFSLYLIHGPVIWLIGEPLMRHFGHDVTLRVAIDALTVVLSLAAAVAFSPANALAISASRRIGYAVTSRPLSSPATRQQQS